MGRFLSVRRTEWLPGVAILVVSVALAVLLGSAIQVGSWVSYVGLVVALVLLFGWLERRRDAQLRPASRPSRARNRLRVADGERDAKHDLSNDDATNDQKYVM
jgi:O-antigen/teichoic acid export membrane protein